MDGDAEWMRQWGVFVCVGGLVCAGGLLGALVCVCVCVGWPGHVVGALGEPLPGCLTLDRCYGLSEPGVSSKMARKMPLARWRHGGNGRPLQTPSHPSQLPWSPGKTKIKILLEDNENYFVLYRAPHNLNNETWKPSFLQEEAGGHPSYVKGRRWGGDDKAI